jgi:hypothetical protein
MRSLFAAVLLLAGPASADDRRNRPAPSTYNSNSSYYGSQSRPVFNDTPTTSQYRGPQYILGHSDPPPSWSYGSYAPAPPRMAPTGPAKPPKMEDFSDQYSMMVQQYIEAKGQDGVFTIRDDQTGKLMRLKFQGIPKGQIRQPKSGEVNGCAMFETAQGQKVDLDFRMAKEDWDWKIQDFMIHSVAGVERYRYEGNSLVAAGGIEPPAPEPPSAPAPAAPERRQVLRTPAPNEAPKPKAPAGLSLNAVFREPSGDHRLEGDEEASVEVTVSNAGPGAAYNVRLAVAGSANGLSFPVSTELGDIRSGKSVVATLPIEAAQELASGKARLELKAREANGFDSDPVVIEFETKAMKPPKLEVLAVNLAGGKAVNPGEASRVVVTIKNKGQGAAKDVTATVKLNSGDLFLSGDETAKLGTIKPGQAKQADFEFFVNKRAKSGAKLPITVDVSEAKGRYGLDSYALGLKVGERRAAPAVITVTGTAEENEAAGPEDVDEPPRSATKRRSNAFAVVVGIEKYRDVPGVDFAARDAQSVHDYLTRSMGFDARNVVLLQDDRATLTDLTTYLGPWLKDRVDKDSKVFIFFAGHGAPNPKGDAFLIPYDGNASYVETKAYPLSRLFETLKTLPAEDVTVALDACFSGGGARSVLAAGARPLVHAKSLPPLGRNVVLLTATGQDQISTYYKDAQHGLLTYFMLKGLRGAADADGDKAVTTVELFSYLQPAVEGEARRQHVEQTPTLTPSPGALGNRGGDVWIKLR